ncbi:Alpha/Beta hydrolase protein [Mycena galopus ATCC 62051]|nr:Alpha/Beta hydrolase protein [Mycena galopus ATCC 62051]
MLALIPLLSLLPAALGAPLSIFGQTLGGSTDSDEATGTPTPVSLATVNSTLLRPAQFARAAYCGSAQLTTWTCGAPCDALKDITFLQSGGDQGAIPLYYIAHDADQQQLVVAHEGTDPVKFLSILNDAQFGLVALNQSRFPQNANGSIQVHSGFQETFERTADGLLAGVKAGLAATGVSKIAVTGHSLGAALATMTGMMIKDAVDPSVAVTLGVTFVTNQHDPVPIVPPKALGFQHSSGEVHITDDTQQNLVACPGQDNINCSTGNSLIEFDIVNHLGPYFDDITFGSPQCAGGIFGQ